MASITQITDFIGQINIPNKDINGENLQSFVDKYEPLFLDQLLGVELNRLYTATPAADRFTALLPYFKLAAANYIYWFYMDDQQTITLGTGTGQPKKQNAVTVSPYPKMVRAWNEMTDLNRKTYKFLSGNAVYPEFTYVMPSVFYVNGWFPDIDESYYADLLCRVPDIYKYKNRLGV